MRFEQSLRDAVKAVQIVDSVRVPGGATQKQQQQQQQQGGGIGQISQQQQSGAGQQGQGNRPHPAFLQESVLTFSLLRKDSFYDGVVGSSS